MGWRLGFHKATLRLLHEMAIDKNRARFGEPLCLTSLPHECSFEFQVVLRRACRELSLASRSMKQEHSVGGFVRIFAVNVGNVGIHAGEDLNAAVFPSLFHQAPGMLGA